MELQLGLALPAVAHNHDHVKGFDLNNYNGLKYLDKKRSFEDACGGSVAKQTLPLLLWSGQPNEDDGRDGDRNGISCKLFNKEEDGGGDEDEVVGWPPIQSWRKKLLQDQRHHYGHDQGGNHEVLANPRVMANNGGLDSDTFSMYVKVKMQGVAITRKIDLSLYNSYHTLTNSLITMFDKYSGCTGNKFHCAQHYTLTYQDKDGDWLLAGDVPWQTFIRSVKRLEIAKNG